MIVPTVKHERTLVATDGIASRRRVQCQFRNLIRIQRGVTDVSPRRINPISVTKTLPSSRRKDSIDITFQSIVLRLDGLALPLTASEDLRCQRRKEADGIMNDVAPFTTPLTIFACCNVTARENIRTTNEFVRLLRI